MTNKDIVEFFEALKLLAKEKGIDVNYLLERGFAFLTPNPPGVVTFAKGIDRIGMHDSVETLREWLKNKSAGMASAGAVKQNGELSHGSAWVKTAKPEIHKAFYKKVREAKPDVKILHYYHSYIDIKSKMDRPITAIRTCRFSLPLKAPSGAKCRKAVWNG